MEAFCFLSFRWRYSSVFLSLTKCDELTATLGKIIFGSQVVERATVAGRGAFATGLTGVLPVLGDGWIDPIF